MFDSLQANTLDGGPAPRDRIIETRLTEQLGVSRTFIHQAISHLECDRPARRLRRTGWVTVALLRKDPDDFPESRLLPEALVSRKLLNEPRLGVRSCCSALSRQ